jgi:hypothetical protein
MAPRLSEEEIDDLVYLARAGEDADLTEMLRDLAARDATTPAEILATARDDQGKVTCLHMAAANGHASKFPPVSDFGSSLCRSAIIPLP